LVQRIFSPKGRGGKIKASASDLREVVSIQRKGTNMERAPRVRRI
jgi:hypothetical protein